MTLFPIHLLASDRPARDAGLISIPSIVHAFCVSFSCPPPSLLLARFSLNDVSASVEGK
jgi:hypothetical protein